MQLGGFGIVVFTAILAISLFRGVSEDSPFRKVIPEIFLTIPVTLAKIQYSFL
jgi:hypothetical protein